MSLRRLGREPDIQGETKHELITLSLITLKLLTLLYTPAVSDCGFVDHIVVIQGLGVH